MDLDGRSSHVECSHYDGDEEEDDSEGDRENECRLLESHPFAITEKKVNDKDASTINSILQ